MTTAAPLQPRRDDPGACTVDLAGYPCGAGPDHPIHHGRWELGRGEPAHTYQPATHTDTSRRGTYRPRLVRG